jgi:ABC-type Fe3+/spermidine/putrescine transport system ATPase subunit
MQVGTPRDLYRRPVSRFVAQFIGETNFVPGTLQGRDNGLRGGANARRRFARHAARRRCAGRAGSVVLDSPRKLARRARTRRAQALRCKTATTTCPLICATPCIWVSASNTARF